MARLGTSDRLLVAAIVGAAGLYAAQALLDQPDSASTVAAMVADLPTLKGIRDDRDPAKVEALLRRRGIDYASYADWRALDAHEVALGAPRAAPGVKVRAVPKMMEIIRRGLE